MIIRLYTSQLRHLVSNYRAGTVVAPITGVHAIVKNPADDAEIKEHREQVVELRKRGLVVIPGFRLMDAAPLFSDWWSVDRWARNRLYLARVGEGEQMIAIDCEAYAVTSGPEVPTIKNLGENAEAADAAWQPFTRDLEKFRVAIYPANPDDEFVRAVADRHYDGADTELWDESTFGLEVDLAMNPARIEARALKSALLRERLRGYYPLARVRGAAFDDILRTWGAPARARTDLFGDSQPWVFLEDRDGESQIGTEAWCRGIVDSPTNAVTNAWTFGAGGVRVTGAGTVDMKPIQLLGKPATDRRSASGFVVADGWALCAQGVIPRDGRDWFACVEVTVPEGTGDRPWCMGGSQKNTPRAWAVCATSPGRRRLGIGCVDGMLLDATGLFHGGVGAHGGHLWIGADYLGGIQRVADGLVVHAVEVTIGTPTPEILRAVEAKRWPR